MAGSSCGGIGESGGLLKSLQTNLSQKYQAAMHPTVPDPAGEDNSLQLQKAAELSAMGIGAKFSIEA